MRGMNCTGCSSSPDNKFTQLPREIELSKMNPGLTVLKTYGQQK